MSSADIDATIPPEAPVAAGSKLPALINRLLILLGFIGIFDAGMLTLADTIGANLPCGQAHGCETVAHSPYSHIWVFPVAVIGLIGYLMLTILASSREYMGSEDQTSLKSNIVLSAIGFLASAYFMAIMFGKIHSICLWCIGSAVNMTLTLILSVVLYKLVSDAVKARGETRNGAALAHQPWPIVVPALAVLTVFGLGFFAVQLTSETGIKEVTINAATEQELVGPGAHIQNPGGQMTIVEFGDLVCPVCHRIYPQVSQIVKESQGKIRFVFHNFPLYQNPQHKDALPGAMMAEIAGEKGKFWDFVDTVYSTQPQGAEPGQEGATDSMVTLSQMYLVMQQLGFKTDAVMSRLSKMSDTGNNDPALEQVTKDLGMAAKLGLTGTPSYIVFAPGQPVRMAQANVMDLLNQPAYKKYWSDTGDSGSAGK